MIIIGISISAPAEVRNAGIVPAADAMAYCYGSDVFGSIMILGGICGNSNKLEWFYRGFHKNYICHGAGQNASSFFRKAA